MKTKFNRAEEFIEEMTQDAKEEAIARKIVRLTKQFTQTKLSPNIQHVQVIATYALKDGGVVRLETYCGDVWGIGTTDNQVMAKTEELCAKIEGAAESLKLEVRAGVLEEEKV